MPLNRSPLDRETILVVDDEPLVLNIVSSVLCHAGFDVLCAANPHAALRIAADHQAPIHLLVCDVILPGLSGPSMAELFAELHPETVCLFIAGLPDNPEVLERILARGRAFLPKPFVPQTLLSKVREVLASAGRRAFAAPA
jgi:two-component system cell cycle sensor histidine kinase/response regulator CckA